MNKITWDNEIPILSDKGVLGAELRPVWFEELNLFCKEPFDALGIKLPASGVSNFWAVGNFYYLAGQFCGRIINNEFVIAEQSPLNSTPKTEDMFYSLSDLIVGECNMNAVLEKNSNFLLDLENSTIKKMDSFFNSPRSAPIDICYSGGKDSEVLLDLFFRSNSKGNSRFRVVFNDTMQELPYTYEAVKNAENLCLEKGIQFERTINNIPPLQLWECMCPPSSNVRWCCRVYKGSFSEGSCVSVCGVRASESAKRSKYDEVSEGTKFAGVVQFYPMLSWSAFGVWLYVFKHNLHINTEYKLGLHRCGCICCPNASPTTQHRIKTLHPAEIMPFLDCINRLCKEPAEWGKAFGELHTINLPYIDTKGKDFARYCITEDIKPKKEWLKIAETDLFEGACFGKGAEILIPAKSETYASKILDRTLACVCCGACVKQCRTMALKMDFEKQQVSIDENLCCRCKSCVKNECLRVYNLRNSASLNLKDILEMENEN